MLNPDTVDIKGHDSTIGYSRNVGRPLTTSSSIVRLLQDAGALIHVKTTVPTGLLALETVSDIFGRTTNPYNSNHTAGASTGGGGALVACGGSKIEIGTDIGGSVRIPAHFCGIWSLRASAGRFPMWGSGSSMMGLEGLPIVASPMAGNLEDLYEFSKRVILAKPWQYDHTVRFFVILFFFGEGGGVCFSFLTSFEQCVPLPWKTVNLRDEGRRLKWGVIWEDGKFGFVLFFFAKSWLIGTIPPSPACKRALSQVILALKKQGHEVVDLYVVRFQWVFFFWSYHSLTSQAPNVWKGLKIGYELLFSDGGTCLGKVPFFWISNENFFSQGHQITNALSPKETITPAAKSILDLLQLPRLIKKILAFFIRSKDPIASEVYGIMHRKTVIQERELIVARDVYRAEWHEKWTEEGLDFVLTVPHAFPALENGTSEQTTLMSAGYTLLFNLVSCLFFFSTPDPNIFPFFFLFFFFELRKRIAWLHCWCTPYHICG